MDVVSRLLAGALLAALALACTSDEEPPAATATPPAIATVSPTATPSPTATRTPTATPSPTATTPEPSVTPYAVTFARGDEIDLSPAVVFVDVESGESTAWVFPGAWPEFDVAPSGEFILWREALPEGGLGPMHLLRTDDGSDRLVEADSTAIEFGPGDTGFLATTQDGFVLTAFDGHGERVADLWLGATARTMTAAWSPDGRSVAIAGRSTSDGVRMSIRAEIPGPPTEEFAVSVPARSSVALEWSHDSERLVLVVEDAVRVFGRDGELLWESQGHFWGNPRWSPDDRFLYVHELPIARRGGAEIAGILASHLFTREGQLLFRVPSAASCAGDPWSFEGDALEFGRYRISVDGTLTEVEDGRHPGVFSRFDSPVDAALMVRWVFDAGAARRLERLLADGASEMLLKLPAGEGFHFAHYGLSDTTWWTDDGRYVFTTPEIGHGGCGEGSPAPEQPPVGVERPPFDSDEVETNGR